MGNIIALAAFLTVLAGFIYVFINTSPATLANLARMLLPITGVLIGIGLIVAGRAGFGFPLLMISGFAFARARSAGIATDGKRQTSTVRSAWLEMQLDHDTGDLEGVVLTGTREGERLSGMDAETLFALYADLSGDNESAALMEAYLDRRIPGWRDSTQTDADAGSREPLSSGAMSKEEAYQVLGLEPGATEKEIRAAHRHLMKSVHPDSGGSTFLAARINQAKETLLE